MPLTEKKRTWLENRKNLCARCEWNSYDNPCVQYGRRGESGECPGFHFRVMESEDLGDVAEFEARVARELTSPVGDYMPLCFPEDCDFHASCRECRLMHARIAVEAEMDGGANG